MLHFIRFSSSPAFSCPEVQDGQNPVRLSFLDGIERLRRLRRWCTGRRSLRHLPCLTGDSHVALATSAGFSRTTHTAAHLTGIILRAVVGGHVAAVVGISSITVQCGIAAAIAGEIHRSAIDGQAAVGVDAVTGGHNNKVATIDDDKAVGVDGKLILSRPSAAKS